MQKNIYIYNIKVDLICKHNLLMEVDLLIYIRQKLVKNNFIFYFTLFYYNLKEYMTE